MSRINFQELPEGLMPLLMKTETYLEELDLDLNLIELMRLIASNINQCHYCIALHKKIALGAGESKERLGSITLWRDSFLYSSMEKASFAWAEYITNPTRYENEEELFSNMSLYFTKEEIANLTLVMTQINCWNRLMKSFGIEE